MTAIVPSPGLDEEKPAALARGNFEVTADTGAIRRSVRRVPHHIVIERENFPSRTVVTVMPRTVEWPPQRYALDEHADEAAAILRDLTGFPIVDQRSPAAAPGT